MALSNTGGALCFICKSETEDFNHFAVICPNFQRGIRVPLSSNPLDGSHITGFICNLAPQERLQLLIGGLPLPFDSLKNTLITRLVSSALGEIFKTRTEILRELEAPWIARK